MKRITIIKRYLSKSAAVKLAAAKRKEIKLSGCEDGWRVAVARAIEYSSPELRKDIGRPCALDFIVVVLFNAPVAEGSVPVVTKNSSNMVKSKKVTGCNKLENCRPVIKMMPVPNFIKRNSAFKRITFESFSSKELIAFQQKQLRTRAA